MRASKQFKRVAGTLAGVGAATAFLMGQPLIGIAFCTVGALLGVSTLHRLGHQVDLLIGGEPLRAPIPSLEQRRRMLQNVA